MNKITIKHIANYTTISNVLFKDKSLSITDRGLLCTVLSLHNSWELTVSGLQSILPDGRDKLRASLNRLIALGYCNRVKSICENGKFNGYDYEFCEEPIFLPQTAKPFTENPFTAKPFTENQTQYNNQLNKITNEVNNNLIEDFANLQKFDNLNDNLASGRIAPQAKENFKNKEKSCEKKEIPAEWQEIVNVWLEYKQKRKQTYKDDDSIYLFYKKLLRLSLSSLEIARQIIEDSMANNYSGIFAPKNISSSKSSPQGGGQITQVEL